MYLTLLDFYSQKFVIIALVEKVDNTPPPPPKRAQATTATSGGSSSAPAASLDGMITRNCNLIIIIEIYFIPPLRYRRDSGRDEL